MHAVADAVLPVFALIGIGFLAGRAGILDAGVTASLNLFVVWLALPAVLFGAAARMSWADVDHPAFALAACGGMGATFALAFALERDRTKRLADRAIEALDASYGNTGFLGIPLGLALFGRDLLPALVISTLFTTCVLFALAILLIEVDLAASTDLRRTLLGVAASLARNPLVAAPALGGAWAATGLALPMPLGRVVDLLGAGAAPCALVTVGLFLQQNRGRADRAEVARLVGLKLVGQPLLTLGIALLVPMPKPWFDAALLLAALPTGTGPFMLARLYGREAAATSDAILVSTVLSVGTVSALAAWFAR